MMPGIALSSFGAKPEAHSHAPSYGSSMSAPTDAPARTAAGILRPLLAVAAVALGVVAYRVQVHDLDSPAVRAAATVAVAWTFVAAGTAGWVRRPDGRLGPLLVAAGLALLARQLRYSHDALAFTVFFLLGDLGYVLVGHATLAYPTGRVTSRLERRLLLAAYVTALVFPVTILALHGSHGSLREFDPYPRSSLFQLADEQGFVLDLQKAFAAVLYGGFAAALIVLILHRLARSTKRSRRLLAPLLIAAIAIALRAVFEGIFTFIGRPLAYDYVFWWQICAFIALPVALLVGALRARLARATVGDLVVELEHTPPEGVRDALARALGDRSLELAFWLPERHAFVDATGSAFELPDDERRAVTPLGTAGDPIAALIHDPSLLDEPRLVEAAAAAARLALENARLHAELRAQLQEVQESRRRLVTAADDERRRIEHDLHDGAQQRLVALAVRLRMAQRELGTAADPELERVLATSVDELQAAVIELRQLAHGVRPSMLTEEGLGAALASLALRAPLPVSLDVLDDRLPPEIEAAGYFVACEALANTVKHAQASQVSIMARRRGATLVVEVSDDGVGGARGDAVGLRGLADRVEALGGRLQIESAPGAGTRVRGEIPCES
jgi:signal transduction histidine kinase